MKRGITILFIFMLLLAQYARQLSYMGCKLYNTVSTTTLNCDCEKLATDTPTDYGHTKHRHLQADDYIVTNHNETEYCFSNTDKTMRVPYTSGITPGFLTKLKKPPQPVAVFFTA